MAETTTKPEKPSQKPIETVRVIVKDVDGNILLLKKSDKSIAKGLYEFPGGKIEEISGESSTITEQEVCAYKELGEEAGINDKDMQLKMVGNFTYEFGNNPEYNNKRIVHVFTAEVKTSKPPLMVGQTKNALGLPEDFHDNYLWVTKDMLDKLKSENKLLGNSSNYESFV